MCEQCLWRAALLERSWGDVPKFLSAVDLSTVQNTKHRGTHREFAWGSCVPQSLNSYRLLHSKQASYHVFTNAWYGYTWAATRTPTCMHMQATTVQKTQTYPTAMVTCIQTLTPNATNTSNACCIPYSVHIRTWHTGYNWLQVLHMYVPDRHNCYTYVTGRVWCDMCQVMGNFSLLIHLHTYGPLRLNGYMWLSIQYNDGGQCVMCAYVHTSMCPLYLYASSRFLVSRIKRLKRKTCRSSVPRNGMFDARPE